VWQINPPQQKNCCFNAGTPVLTGTGMVAVAPPQVEVPTAGHPYVIGWTLNTLWKFGEPRSQQKNSSSKTHQDFARVGQAKVGTSTEENVGVPTFVSNQHSEW